MTNANLPPNRTTFGIGKTIGGAWQNAMHSWGRVSSFASGVFGPAASKNNPYGVTDLIAQSHSALHEQMANQALTQARTGRTILPVGSVGHVAPSLDTSGLTAVGQHSGYVSSDFAGLSPITSALKTNGFDRNLGSIEYSIPAGNSIHDAVPYQPGYGA